MFLVRMNGIKIIFTDKHNGKFLERRKIHTLMKYAFFNRTISEENNHDAILLFESQRMGKSGSHWNGGRDNGGGPHHPASGIDQMHGPAFSFRTAGGFAIELCDHFLKISSLGQVEGVS